MCVFVIRGVSRMSGLRDKKKCKCDLASAYNEIMCIDVCVFVCKNALNAGTSSPLKLVHSTIF